MILYRILEFVFGTIKGFLDSVNVFVTKIESFFKDKIEYYHLDHLYQEDIMFLKKDTETRQRII